MNSSKDSRSPHLDEDRVMAAWNDAADALESDPMRPVRYEKCMRYLLELSRASSILEIGCGEGTGLSLMRELGFRNLIGIDVSGERVKRARRKLDAKTGIILVSPFDDLPLMDNSVDAVITAAVIEHAVSQAHFVGEIARVLRPGGSAVISSDCYSWRILQMLRLYRSVQPIDRALFPATLMRIFRQSGLKLIDYEGFPLPGEEFRFLRLLTRGTAARFLPKADSSRDRKKARRWSKVGKLIFSDENVFFLKKTAGPA